MPRWLTEPVEVLRRYDSIDDADIEQAAMAGAEAVHAASLLRPSAAPAPKPAKGGKPPLYDRDE
jgi:hypothetical protein